MNYQSGRQVTLYRDFGICCGNKSQKFFHSIPQLSCVDMTEKDYSSKTAKPVVSTETLDV